MGRRYLPVLARTSFWDIGCVLARRSAGRDGILEGAGLTDVMFSDVNRPVYYGLTWLPPSAGSAASRAPARRSSGWIPPAATRALERIGEMLAVHMTGDGVWLDSRAGIVTARRV